MSLPFDARYDDIIDDLRRKLSNHNHTGKRKEGFEDGIRSAMSIVHSYK